jgi:hypothetical protein
MLNQKPFADLGNMINKTWEVIFWREIVNSGEEYEFNKDSLVLDAKSKQEAREAVQKLIAEWKGYIVNINEIK